MKTVSREELHKQVWSTPMFKVASEYGVSGQVLKDTCDRHGIPTPGHGYWMKLKHGKTVEKEALPPPPEPGMVLVRISVSSQPHLSSLVLQAKEVARDKLRRHAAARPRASAASEPGPGFIEPPFLALTRHAISKEHPDDEGFVTIRSKGLVPVKIAPASVERAIDILTQLIALAETQGHFPRVTEDGLVLVVYNELVAFRLEEQPEKCPRQPTPAGLKRRGEQRRGRRAKEVSPKHDQIPSGRLAIIIDANPHSGLRGTFADGKTQALERMLPDVLAGFVEHAAYIGEHRREADEGARRHQAAEALRRREEAFSSREMRRMDFVDAVHEQLAQRARLTTVLRHLESATSDGAKASDAMVIWIRRRLRQVDALVSPRFLEASARSSKVDFAEPHPEKAAEGGSFYHSPPIKLELWSVDSETGIPTSCSPLEWASVDGGLAVERNQTE